MATTGVNWTTIALAFGVLGLVARLVFVIRSLGSNDITTWASFATSIRATSLGHVYDTIEGFNHPPLMGLFSALVDAFATRFHARFDIVFKVPIILAECVGAVLIYRHWRKRRPKLAAAAFVLFCWNPASFLVSAHHGNTDSLCAMLSLLAALLMDSGHPLLGGLALAGSINVKLIGLLLIPVLLSCATSWRNAARFVGGLSAGALPFLPFVLFHWTGFRAHVLDYNSYPGYWGVTHLLVALGSTPHFAETSNRIFTTYATVGKTIVLAMPLLLAAINVSTGRRWDARRLAAIVYCTFLVVTPGFGLQYIVYPVLLLFSVDLGRAVLYSWTAGIYAAVIYLGLWTGTTPAFSDFNHAYPVAAQSLGYITWAVLLQTVIGLLRGKPTRWAAPPSADSVPLPA